MFLEGLYFCKFYMNNTYWMNRQMEKDPRQIIPKSIVFKCKDNIENMGWGNILSKFEEKK